ncbi:MAG TPA: metallopeptidase family protein [Bacteroidota bacterium]|nr:metallopeptidase family protein [Bacteroidota bacterium]
MKPRLSREAFEEIVERSFETLPSKFRDKIDNVQIVVEDYPDEEALRGSRSSKYELLGLYQGIPLNRRGTWYGASPTLPDKITLYQKNIEMACRTEGEIEHRIAEVLFHEIGHYFGMNEREIRAAMKDFEL